MTAARPHFHWYACPNCHEEGAAIGVKRPVARQKAVFFLCDCYDTGRVQIDGEHELRTPHESLVKAVRDFGDGNVPVCLEGHPEKSFDDIEELLAAYSDFTQPPAGAVRSRHELNGAASDELADVTEPEPSEAETDEEQRDEEDDPLLFDPATFRPQDESERAKFKAAFAYIGRDTRSPSRRFPIPAQRRSGWPERS